MPCKITALRQDTDADRSNAPGALMPLGQVGGPIRHCPDHQNPYNMSLKWRASMEKGC